MKKSFSLVCIAPDGDFITEACNFPSVGAAWDRSNDMGSRWIFYPIHVVTATGPRSIIRAVPHGMSKQWLGRQLKTLRAAIASDEQHACNYCNGLTPFCIEP